MNTNKVLEKLDKFFHLPQGKKEKKQKKLLKLIDALESKKEELEQQVTSAAMEDETSDRYRELERELKVVSRLIKKAKKQRIVTE